MPSISDRQIALIAMTAAVVAVVVSLFALKQSYRQFNEDYDAAAVLTPGILPITTIAAEKPVKLDLTVTNTAKANLAYYLRANSNSACITGEDSRPQLLPCKFESSVIKLSKPEAGSHSQKHKITISAPNEVHMSALAYESDPEHFIEIQVINASNGKTLIASKCYYTFNPKSKSLDIYRPVLDTSGNSKRLQAKCGD